MWACVYKRQSLTLNMPRRHRWYLTLGLDGGRWSIQRRGCFIPWKVTSVLVAQEAVWACGSAFSGTENPSLA